MVTAAVRRLGVRRLIRGGLGQIRRRLGRWLPAVPVGMGLVAVAVALAVPAPAPPAAPPPPGTDGPPRLTQVWPQARVMVLAGTLPDGRTIQPLIVMDPVVVGLATSPNFASRALVVRSGAGELRQLRMLAGPSTATVAAVAVDGDQLYWLELADAGGGARQTSVWRADLRDGSARRLAGDDSDVLYFDSAYDLQVTGGQVHWAAARPGGGGQLHTVSVEGGPVSVRPFDRLYALTVWPWVTSSGSGAPGRVELLNLDTGERRGVIAGPSEILTCSPVWCRVTTLVSQGQGLRHEVARVDGSDRRTIGNTTLTPLNVDVALLDRFEVLASTTSGRTSGYAQSLWLHDLLTNQVVLLDDAVTATIGSRGSFLWWSTGDNEAVSWHILDLRQLIA